MLLATFILLQLTQALCREYMIEKKNYIPYAFNDVKISSSQGFDKPVFVFAEFASGRDALVFKTEELAYTKEITAKYYAKGKILALSLYLDPKKTTLLARVEMQQPENNLDLTVDNFAYTDFQMPLDPNSRIKPARYMPFSILLALSVTFAASRKKWHDTASGRVAMLTVIIASSMAATALLLLYSEKPSLAEITGVDAPGSPAFAMAPGTGKINYSRVISTILTDKFEGYSHLIVQSSGKSRFPLEPLSGLAKIMFDKIPIIELSVTGEYFLQKNTNLKAWIKYE